MRAVAPLLLCAFTAWAAPNRYALLIGENHGDDADEPLRYAVSDARRMAEVLESVGGVAPDHATLLAGASADDVRNAMSALNPRIGPGDQLIVYVSSHADEGQLHLKGTRLSLSELNDFIRGARASVAILIVDSCRSGALTRLKGLKPTDGPVQVQAAQIAGRVIISSSGADEYAQESDQLRSSYFTHHLVTGLRGAADVSRDGVVTLEEAYAYAYARTIESTFASRGGMQHPGYHVDLKGSGELVMSDLRLADAELWIDVEPPGEWLITTADARTVVAQVDKGRGRLVLALPAGTYRVGTREGDGYLEREVSLPAHGSAAVDSGGLLRAPLPAVTLKGGGLTLLTASVGGAATNGMLVGGDAIAGAQARLRFTRPRLLGWLDTAALTFSFQTGPGGHVVAFTQNELTVAAGPGRSWQWGRVFVAAGIQPEAVLVAQSGLPTGSRVGLEAGLGADLELQLRLAGPWLLFVNGGASVLAVKTVAGTTAVPRGGGAVGLALRL